MGSVRILPGRPFGTRSQTGEADGAGDEEEEFSLEELDALLPGVDSGHWTELEIPLPR